LSNLKYFVHPRGVKRITRRNTVVFVLEVPIYHPDCSTDDRCKLE